MEKILGWKPQDLHQVKYDYQVQWGAGLICAHFCPTKSHTVKNWWKQPPSSSPPPSPPSTSPLFSPSPLPFPPSHCTWLWHKESLWGVEVIFVELCCHPESHMVNKYWKQPIFFSSWPGQSHIHIFLPSITFFLCIFIFVDNYLFFIFFIILFLSFIRPSLPV